MAKDDKTNAMRILDKEKIWYEPHIYDVSDGNIDGMSVANKLNQNPEQVFKTLVTQGASREYYVFVVQVNKELDLKAAAKAVGEKSIAMIKSADLLKTTGYIHGGCSPIGMKKLFKTVIDKSCEEQETMCVSAGKIGYQIEIKPEDLIALTKAQTANVSI